MRYNLIVNYYTDSRQERQNELNHCILENLKNSFNNILIVSNEKDYEILLSICPEYLKEKLLPIIVDNRPTYNDYFNLINKCFSGNDDINVISNLDIIIPNETLIYCSLYLNDRKSCLALTRYDIKNINDYKNNSTFFDRVDSQDTWIFRGNIPNIVSADFGLGIAGCDNKIAYLLESIGYNVINPSLTLKTYHYHITNIRNYINVVGEVINRVPPPYKLLPPTA